MNWTLLIDENTRKHHTYYFIIDVLLFVCYWVNLIGGPFLERKSNDLLAKDGCYLLIVIGEATYCYCSMLLVTHISQFKIFNGIFITFLGSIVIVIH